MAHTRPTDQQKSHWWWLLWLLPIPLLWVALRSVPLQRVLDLIRQLTLGELGLLALVNVVVLATFTARWWLILRSQGVGIGFPSLMGYRLASFAVSYFTPGPQFGGEPIQVMLLQRRHKVAEAAAIASVTLEKTIELVVNGLIIFIGAMIVFQNQIFPAFDARGLAGAVMLAGVPLGFLGLLWYGVRPLSPVLDVLPASLQAKGGYERIYQAIYEAESEGIQLCKDHRHTVMAAAAVSVISWVFIGVEFALALRILEVNLLPIEIVTMVLAARVAVLLPSPGGLGAVEASQALVMEAFGYDPAIGIAVSVLIRARDILFGAIGLGVGGVSMYSQTEVE